MSEEAETPPQTNGRRRELTLRLPGGISFTFRGYDVIMVLLACAISVLVYMGWETKENRKTEHQMIYTVQDKQNEVLNTMAYILTLTPEERKKLNLAMPDALRKRVRASRDD